MNNNSLRPLAQGSAQEELISVSPDTGNPYTHEPRIAFAQLSSEDLITLEVDAEDQRPERSEPVIEQHPICQRRETIEMTVKNDQFVISFHAVNTVHETDPDCHERILYNWNEYVKKLLCRGRGWPDVFDIWTEVKDGAIYGTFSTRQEMTENLLRNDGLFGRMHRCGFRASISRGLLVFWPNNILEMPMSMQEFRNGGFEDVASNGDHEMVG